MTSRRTFLASVLTGVGTLMVAPVISFTQQPHQCLFGPPTDEQHIALVKRLLQDGLNAHDDLLEKALFQ